MQKKRIENDCSIAYNSKKVNECDAGSLLFAEGTIVKQIWVLSTEDGTEQPSLFYKAQGKHRPLLVGLHTWSGDRTNQMDKLRPLAEKYDWNLLLPEFRGGNLRKNPNCRDACGSRKAKQDIIDAIAFVKQNYDIDADNILLLGASGGGHMALLMAAYAPELWRCVGAFVPVVDLEKWHRENANYRDHIEACCGGAPSELTKEEYQYRSPIAHIGQIAKANVKIFTGKWDKIIPCHHGLDIYNCIFASHPEAKVYFEMFDGGHEMPLEMASQWLCSQLSDTERHTEQVTG